MQIFIANSFKKQDVLHGDALNSSRVSILTEHVWGSNYHAGFTNRKNKFQTLVISKSVAPRLYTSAKMERFFHTLLATATSEMKKVFLRREER